jgi:addiction module HigA family antidote
LPLITPGEILREEFLDPLGLSANQLAKALRVPANRITGILNGSRGITPETALRLGRYFGTSAEMWVNLQNNYDMRLARRESGARIEREVKPRVAPAA